MENELSVWSLITSNQLQKACEKADEEYEQKNDMYFLRNKIYAFYHLRKYNDVIALSERLMIDCNREVSIDFLSSGISHWILGNIPNAIDAWQRGQNTAYTDAAGGVEVQIYLYFAGVKTGQKQLKLDAIRAIKKKLKSKRSINFPGSLGHFLLDRINNFELLSQITDVPILRERHLSQVHFVIAIKLLEAGDELGYYQKLKDCISYGPASYLSLPYYLAKGELENR